MLILAKGKLRSTEIQPAYQMSRPETHHLAFLRALGFRFGKKVELEAIIGVGC